MSSCIITIKNTNWMKREIILYQHTDGHPNSSMLPLTESLSDIYQEFRDHGDTNWFLDPTKLAGILVVRSVPVFTEEMKSLMKSLPSSARHRMESNLFLGMPTLFPDVVKLSECNYEYSITLSEEIDEGDITKFFGYSIEVYKLQNRRRVSTIMKNQKNFMNSSSPIALEMD